MKFRKTGLDDIQTVMQIYADARRFMAQTGNPGQWGDNYPEEALIRKDIEEGISYVAESEGKIAAVFVFFQGEDPTYRHIEDGAWKKDGPYGVIHRIAAAGGVRGAGSQCLQWGFSQCGNLRIDTHDDNKVMQHVLEKNGFERCGRIYLQDGSPRVAFQKTK